MPFFQLCTFLTLYLKTQKILYVNPGKKPSVDFWVTQTGWYHFILFETAESDCVQRCVPATDKDMPILVAELRDHYPRAYMALAVTCAGMVLSAAS